MNDDLISRQAAIDKLKREEKIFYSPTGLRYLIGAIRDLPSAQPQDIARDIATIIENEKDMHVVLKQPRWIPCSERLPTTKDDYIITVKDKSLTWTDYDEWSADYHWWEYDDDMVIAWMPLPEPYKGEKA